MNFDYSPQVVQLRERLLAFFAEHITPNEKRYLDEVAANRRAGNPWLPTTVIEELKPKARAAGLWNLFLPKSSRAPEGLSTSNTRRCARSWAGCSGRPRSSTARRPTPATWRRWSAMPARR